MDIKSIVKKTIIVIFFSIIAVVVSMAEYQHFFKKDEFTKVYSGIVIQSNKMRTCYLTTVEFEDGSVESVNTGGYEYSVGSKFSSNLDWNVFLGTCGHAYSHTPKEYSLTLGIISMIFHVLVIGVLLYYLCIALIWAFSKDKS